MGNAKSRKMKISQSEAEKDAEPRERINSIKTELAEAAEQSTCVPGNGNEVTSEIDRVKDTDNASSASTVEALDDNNAAARSKSSKMPAHPIKLYYLPPSPPCRAVMMLARVMGLELDLKLTNILEGEHLKPEFLKMNPQHTIPTMDDDGFTLWESRAMMAYFVNAYGRDDSLYPRNPRLRAIVDARLNFDLGTLYLRYLNLYVPMLFKGEEYDEESAKKFDEALGWLNTMLDGKPFVAGENMTIADITMVVTLTNIDAFGYDYSHHGNVVRWFDRMKKALEPHGYDEIDVAGAKILASFLKKE